MSVLCFMWRWWDFPTLSCHHSRAFLKPSTHCAQFIIDNWHRTSVEIRESDFAATHSCNDYDDCCDCDCIHLILRWHESSHSSQPHSAPSWWWQSVLDLFVEASMALDIPSMSDNIFYLSVMKRKMRTRARVNYVWFVQRGRQRKQHMSIDDYRERERDEQIIS